MSMRTIARSSSKRNSASALASSVLPTPVGPRNRKLPVGPLQLALRALQLLGQRRDPLDLLLLQTPPLGEGGQRLAAVGQLLAQAGQALDGGRVGLLGQRHLLDLQPAYRPLDLVHLG